jgi:hypothetical protein
MTITVELPDDFIEGENPSRAAIEALAIAGYRSRSLSPLQTRLLLGFETRYELDAFLKKNKMWEQSYSLEDYEAEVASIKMFEAHELQQR